MKIVDAYWEKRNLGVSTTEFTIENDDEINCVLDVLYKCTSSYQVLKLPSHMTDYIFEVQKLGFVFVEDIFEMRSYLKPTQMDPITFRLHKNITFEQMNEKDFEILLTEINNGLFDSDRVYIDPFFEKEMAAKRYYSWMINEKNNGSLFYKFIYKNKTIGFDVFRDDGNSNYYAVLGGLYTEYKKKRFGTAILETDIVKHLNGKSVYTFVSTNNTKQIKCLLNKGFSIESSSHVFVKHI